MYISDAIVDGLKILSFDKATIKRISKEKKLEEIFLSTLFLNYILILLIYIIGVLIGGYEVSGKAINMPVFFGLLMVYPFSFNIVIYVLYGFFGLTAEMLDNRKHVRPLLSVGFHTAIVYSVILFVIALLSTINSSYGFFLLVVFILYFLYTMFLSISTIYQFSAGQTVINLFIPFIVIGLALLILSIAFPTLSASISEILFLK